MLILFYILSDLLETRAVVILDEAFFWMGFIAVAPFKVALFFYFGYVLDHSLSEISDQVCKKTK